MKMVCRSAFTDSQAPLANFLSVQIPVMVSDSTDS